MPARPCLDCTSLTRRGPRCERCTQAHAARRGTTSQRGYGTAWQRLAAKAIALHPWCTDCGTAGEPANPLTGDHLRWPAHTVDDVEVVCRRCNTARGPLRVTLPRYPTR